ncbi:hypothetical protein INR49_020886, partial [Caranx melampygus]
RPKQISPFSSRTDGSSFRSGLEASAALNAQSGDLIHRRFHVALNVLQAAGIHLLTVEHKEGIGPIEDPGDDVCRRTGVMSFLLMEVTSIQVSDGQLLKGGGGFVLECHSALLVGFLPVV